MPWDETIFIFSDRIPSRGGAIEMKERILPHERIHAAAGRINNLNYTEYTRKSETE